MKEKLIIINPCQIQALIRSGYNSLIFLIDLRNDITWIKSIAFVNYFLYV